MTKHKQEKTEPTETTPLIECQQQLGELTETLQRLQAEFENYKKRAEKESIHIIKNANTKLVTNILPVLDSFELAIKNNNHIEHPEMDKFRKGLELIYAQLFSTLQSEGLQTINTENQKFDPYKHEVLMVKETSQENDTILQEFQKGYTFNDFVIRHSKVMISKKKTEEKKEDQ